MAPTFTVLSALSTETLRGNEHMLEQGRQQAPRRLSQARDTVNESYLMCLDTDFQV